MLTLKSFFKVFLLMFSSLVLVLTSGYAYRMVKENINDEELVYAKVEGNVDNPGYYKVNELTTNQELLAQAGLTSTSNISEVELNQPVNPLAPVEVGETETEVIPKQNSYFNLPQCLFTMGKVNLKRNAETKEVIINQHFKEVDILTTSQNGKARVRYKNLSEMDINNNTQIMFNKMTADASTSETELMLNSGQVLVKVPIETPGGKLTIFTKTIKIEFMGEVAEFIVTARPFSSSIHVGMGRINVTLLDKEKEILMAENQSIIVKQGDDVLEPISKKYSKVTSMEIFGDLQTSYMDYQQGREEVSILISSGGFNLVMSMIPQKQKIVIMDLPPNTYVGDYIEGVYSLDKASVYLGAEITRELVQRLLGRPIKHVISLSSRDIINFAFGIDFLRVDVDPGAAFVLKLAPGIQMLQRENIVKFLNPQLPGGRLMAVTRQKKVFMSFLRLAKSSVKHGFYFVNYLPSIQSNISTTDARKLYKIFYNADTWSYSLVQMPASEFSRGPMLLVKPRYDQILKYF